ncbi:MAG TPA: hypothetical protein VHF45_00030 [Thermoleophilaceae bacterium]|nr:hypothetical protein [Thermoleophilaceae bacterium]
MSRRGAGGVTVWHHDRPLGAGLEPGPSGRQHAHLSEAIGSATT